MLGSIGGNATEWFTADLDFVLSQGDTATGDINLTGNIILTGSGITGIVSASTIEANQALILNGTIEDADSSTGLNGQLLSSTVTGVKWKTIDLQQVLNTGDTASGDITLNGTAIITAKELTSNDTINVNGSITDGNGLIGSPGQVLKATGGNVLWVDTASVFTS